MRDCLIIGAGPAGLTAAIYLRNANKDVLLVERNSPGGKLINIKKIANFPFEGEIGGIDLAMKIYSRSTELGAELTMDTVVSIEKTDGGFKAIGKADSYEAKTVIIASGTRSGGFGVKNEDAFVGKGVSYCATCDGSFYKGERVMAFGHGAEFLEGVEYLKGICGEVVALDSFEGKLLSIEGDGHVEKAMTDKGSEEVKAVFLLGEGTPNDAFYKGLGLETSPSGAIKTKDGMATSIPGVFACGDCIDKRIRQVINASSEGMEAALSAVSFLSRNK